VGFPGRDCSDRTAALLDEEAEELLDQLYEDAKQILDRNRDALVRVATALFERESLDEDQFRDLIEEPAAPPAGSDLNTPTESPRPSPDVDD
jgi:cell division protease FtsH